MPKHTKTYLTDQPWIVIEYPLTDREADILVGEDFVLLHCAICGDRTRWDFTLPSKGDPVWDRIGETGHPEGRKRTDAYRIDHLHEVLQKENPLISWARPLLNPAALKAWGSLDDLKRKIEKE